MVRRPGNPPPPDYLLAWSHGGVLNLSAEPTEMIEGVGCGFLGSGHKAGGEMDSRRAALALKPSRPQLRTDRLHWECRCCVRPAQEVQKELSATQFSGREYVGSSEDDDGE